MLEGVAVTSLWTETMKSLVYLFTYDNIEFIGQERFLKLSGPLVDQFERVSEHDQAYKVKDFSFAAKFSNHFHI